MSYVPGVVGSAAHAPSVRLLQRVAVQVVLHIVVQQPLHSVPRVHLRTPPSEFVEL